LTLEEAKIIARIAGTADSGCTTCVRGLAKRLQKEFPQFNWTAHKQSAFEYMDEDGNILGPDDDWDHCETYVPIDVETV
jgi:hypothetical protein